MSETFKINSRTVTITDWKGFQSEIYRDGKLAGLFPRVPIQYSVSGVCSGCAHTLPAAKARAEYHARSPYHHGLCDYALTDDEALAYLKLEHDHEVALLTKYPFTPAERQSLLGSPHHADLILGQSIESWILRFRQLTGGMPPTSATITEWQNYLKGKS